MKHLEGLNSAQKEAVLHKDGPILIVAGAGAGKTKTIVHRIANLVESGVSPENILAITFTNKAAQELKQRVAALLSNISFDTQLGAEEQHPASYRDMGGDKGVRCPFVTTFHSFCVHILRENARHLGLTRHFKIADQEDSLSLIKIATKESDLDPKQYSPRYFQNIISKMKGEAITLDEWRSGELNYMENLTAEVWEKYASLLKKERALDFDDLLLETVLLLRKNPEIKAHYQNRFKFLHIDEYQDTNQVQYELAGHLAENHRNICVVGDADQNIYSWRGANLRNILNFERDYPGAKVVLLEENYRSTQNILEAANEVIKKNKARVDKNLFTSRGEGEKIALYEALDEADEAEFVAIKIIELRDSGGSWKNSAVLYRANFQSRVLEEAMIRFNVPYQVIGVKFYDRKEVKDILSYMRAAMNPDGLTDIKRIINLPPRGVGKVSLLKIFAGQKNELPSKMQFTIAKFYSLLGEIRDYLLENTVSSSIKFILSASGLEKMLKAGGEDDLERLENIKELVSLAQKYDNLKGEEGASKFLEDVALMSDQDNLKEAVDGVRMMTVHASKGLEFRYVFITGLEQGLFPHDAREGATAEDAEEERRLFYVALTRAQEKVFLSYAASRMIFGSRNFTIPSEFIEDIPVDLIKKEPPHLLKTIYLN